MRYRQLGGSGLRVSVLTMGTMTFGGTGGFASVGSTDLDGAMRQLDRCLEAGINLVDTADVYSDGLSLTQEELARLEEVSRPPLLYPYWHQAKTASDRLGPADLSLLGPQLSG